MYNTRTNIAEGERGIDDRMDQIKGIAGDFC